MSSGVESLLFVQPFFLLIFLPLACVCFYLARRFLGRTAAVAVVVAASAAFYAPYGPLPAAILAASLCINFAIGGFLALSSREHAWRAALLAIGLAVDFLNLATFKYLDQIEAMFRPGVAPILSVAIPAGISFYTFHQAVFLVHAYNKQAEVLAFFSRASSLVGRIDTFVRYAAFVAFFPQLVIGPITYMSELGPQLDRRAVGWLRAGNIQIGVTLVVTGLFKKIVIADALAPLVDRVYYDLHWLVPISATQVLLAVLGYYFQLYFDFSGYSDIALGIARLFGLKLPINFDSPLRATGIVDFYRRWHMTLTRVIVVFVFTPLSLWGTRAAMKRRLKGWPARLISVWLPFLLNFQIIALWHAAKFTFVAFGLAHGLWYIVETEFRRSKLYRRFAANTSERWRTVGGIALTVAPLSLTFALFRSDDIPTFKTLCKSLIGRFQATLTNNGLVDYGAWTTLAAAALIVYLAPNIYELLRDYDPGFRTFENRSITPAGLKAASWKPNVAWGCFVATMALIVLARLNVPSPFLYGRF